LCGAFRPIDVGEQSTLGTEGERGWEKKLWKNKRVRKTNKQRSKVLTQKCASLHVQETRPKALEIFQKSSCNINHT